MSGNGVKEVARHELHPIGTKARIAELEACVLEYWHAKDWGAVGAADATAAKLLPADMKARSDSALDREGEHGGG
jgi:hypothetical protein